MTATSLAFSSNTASYKPAFFQKPIIKALGIATEFQADVFVTSPVICAKVLQDLNIDPTGLPAELRSGNHSVFRCIQLGFRNMYRTDKHTSLSAGRIWTKLGPQIGSWGLTEAGVAQARLLVPAVPQKNLTMAWLDKHLRPKPGERESDLMRLLFSAVRSKLPVSARCSRVEDHIQEYFCKLIRRDALRKDILEGKEITYSHIATYAVNSSFTDIRNDGTEPVCRELYGAKTEYERKHGHTVDQRSSADAHSVAYTSDDDGRMMVIDIVDEDLALGSVDSRLTFERYWPQIVSAFQAQKPKAADRYLCVLKLWSQNKGMDEIASYLGVSKHRATSMVQEARQVVQSLQDLT